MECKRLSNNNVAGTNNGTPLRCLASDIVEKACLSSRKSPTPRTNLLHPSFLLGYWARPFCLDRAAQSFYRAGTWI